MTMVLLVLAIGLGTIGLAGGVLWLEVVTWRQSLVAFELRLPRDLKPEAVSAWLTMLASATHQRPVVLEIVGSVAGIRHYLLVPEPQRSELLNQLRTALPGIRLTPADDYLTTLPTVRAAVELRLSNLARPLNDKRATAAVAALLSGLSGPFARGESVLVQWVLSGTRGARPRRDVSPEVRHAHVAKHDGAMLRATARIAVSAPTIGRGQSLLNRVVDALRIVEAPGVVISRRLLLRSRVAARYQRRSWPALGAWPWLLNAAEAVIVGLPSAHCTCLA